MFIKRNNLHYQNNNISTTNNKPISNYNKRTITIQNRHQMKNNNNLNNNLRTLINNNPSPNSSHWINNNPWYYNSPWLNNSSWLNKSFSLNNSPELNKNLNIQKKPLQFRQTFFLLVIQKDNPVFPFTLIQLSFRYPTPFPNHILPKACSRNHPPLRKYLNKLPRRRVHQRNKFINTTTQSTRQSRDIRTSSLETMMIAMRK